jgi:hypothetical protein
MWRLVVCRVLRKTHGKVQTSGVRLSEPPLTYQRCLITLFCCELWYSSPQIFCPVPDKINLANSWFTGHNLKSHFGKIFAVRKGPFAIFGFL